MSFSRRQMLHRAVFAAAACVARPFQGWARTGASNLSSSVSSGSAPSVGASTDGVPPISKQAFEAVVGTGFKVSALKGVTGAVPKGHAHKTRANSAAPCHTSTSQMPAVWLRLIAVEDLPALAPVNVGAMAVPPKPGSAPSTTGFMLIFTGALPRTLPQDTYAFEHPTLGKFELFIVPGGRGQQSYTAVFNHLN
jgi:hypothetical protein